MIITPFVIASL